MIKYVLLGVWVLLFCFVPTYAQQNWGGGSDHLPFHFGFSFQYISSEDIIVKTKRWQEPFIDQATGEVIKPALSAIRSADNPGFGLGFIANYRLGENFDLRFSPGYIFADQILHYEYKDPKEFEIRHVAFSVVNLPLGIRVKSNRRKNFRAYFIIGPRYTLNLSSYNKIHSDKELPLEKKLLKNKRGLLWYEAGIGFQFYFDHFKLSPELKFSQTIGNVMEPENHPYSSPIEKLFIRTLQFTLYLE